MPTPLDKAQLRKLLLVALSSDQPGEVMNALTMVKAALKRAGLDVHWLADVITASAMPKNTSTVSWEPVATDPRDQLQYCRERSELLSRRETEFIESLDEQSLDRGLRWKPTERQANWLLNIYRRLSTQT